MNPWIPHLLRAGGGGGAVLPTVGRTMLAKLTSSLILDEGTGGPTWSRATKAWGFNELGYLEELASGCAFFGGARLVRNICATKSEDFTSAAWLKNTLTAPSANLLVCANSTAAQNLLSQTTSWPTEPGTVAYFRYRVRYVDIRYVAITCHSGSFGMGAFCNFDLVGKTLSATGCTGTITEVSANVFDIAVRAIATTSALLFLASIDLVNSLTSTRKEAFVGDGIKSLGVLRYSAYDITGYDASYVPEYVSVGVVSTPFFGAGIDGAKYFETDWQGAPIAAANLLRVRREASAINNLLYSRDLTQSAWTQTVGGPGSELITADRTFSTSTGWSLNPGTGTATISGGTANIASIDGSFVSIFLNPQFTVTIGKTYTLEYDVTAVTGGGVRVDFGGGTGPTHTTTGTKRHTVTASTTGAFSIVRGTGISSGSVDNVSCKESAVQCTKTTGLDGIANTATTLTATAADAIILQPISLASAARCASSYVKRRTGTGTISFTQDGGSTWTDITSLINSSTWSRVEITATLANPSVGFKISTSGDAIDVDCAQNEAGAKATSPIVTTTAAVTRDADSLSYQTASNIDFAVGTIYFEASLDSIESSFSQRFVLVGDSYIYRSNGGPANSVAMFDGTSARIINGTNPLTGSGVKVACSWGSLGMIVAASGATATTFAFDGAFGSSASIALLSNASGRIKTTAIYNYQMTDAELQAITA